MSEWKKVKLGELCEITSSKRCLASERSKSGIPFYCSKEIILLDKGNTIHASDYIPYELYADIRSRFGVPQPGDLLLTTRGTNGIPYIYKDDDNFYFADGNLSWFRQFDSRILNKYLYYWFKSIYGISAIDAIAKGTAQKAVPIEGLRRITLTLPPLPIQRRISGILSRYDALIENCQKQIRLLEEAAQRLYKHWFVDMKFPGHENATFDNGLPTGWTRKKIGEVFSYVRGKSYTSKELSDNQGTIMVNLKNIQAFGGYKCDAEKYFLGSYKAEQTLKKGDLVMGVTDMTSERRLVGHVALIPDFGAEATYTMDLIKIIPYSLPKTFIYCAMRYGGVSYKISPLANGVNVLHLKPEAIEGIEMIIPSMHLIESFVGLVDKMIDQILSNQKQIKHLTEARDRLLPRLMSGEIEVS